MNRVVGTRTTFSFALLMALVLVNAVVAYRNLAQMRDIEQQMARTYNVLVALDELQSAVTDAETGQRGYLITGEKKYLTPYNEALAVVEKRRERLHHLPPTRSLTPERLAKLDWLVTAKFAEMKRTIDLYDNWFGGPKAAADEVKNHIGQGLMAQFRDLIDEMSGEENATLDKQQDEARQSYWTAGASTLLAAVLSLGIVALAIHLIRRELFARQEAEAQAHEQREWCLTSLTSIGDAVIVTGEDGRVKLLNPVAKNLTGWDETAVGQPLEAVFPIFNELTRLPVENPADKVLREGKIVGLANHTILRSRDGREIPIDDSGAPIRDKNGRITGVVLVFRDVTQRRHDEEALLKHTAALQEADRRKDEFLAMLAHELRNPLAPIHNAVQILRMEGPSGENFQWSLQVIGDQIRHLTRLVDDLLDVSRITQGKVKLQKENMDLRDVLRRAVETCQPLATERGHNLALEAGDHMIYLAADATRLTQVFSNLLNNAIKYTPNGGRITVTAAVEDGEAVVRVCDNGVGIAPDMLPHIFDLFTQADKSLARTSGGLGIGLTLVRRLVGLHGGSVAASSDGIGKGTEFVVRLPLATGPPTPRSRRPAPEAPVKKDQRILVVDDNHDSSKSLAVLLRATGAQVELAFDGPAALEAARRDKPDVVLLDIGLPGMDGYEVARRLRREPGLEKIVLIAMTGYGSDEDRRRSQEAGFNAHLVKPVDLDTLLILLAQLPYAGC